ncbi:MAG: acyl carrier protein [Chromatiaceae bacterium]|jgi:acyl carrier protein
MTKYQDYLDFMLLVLQKRSEGTVALSANTELVGDIGLTSLEVMELIEKIEDHFDISIPLNILPDINTLGDLAKKLHELGS